MLERDVIADVHAALETAGLRVGELVALAGDASTRRFFRVSERGAAGSAVIAWYPATGHETALHDQAVAVWAMARDLPVPRLRASGPGLSVFDDLGDTDLSGPLHTSPDAALGGALEALAAYQRAPWHDAPNPAFDAPFFRRELDGFEAAYLTPAGVALPGLGGFLDSLAAAVADHPYRLTHRDFHANNLLLRDGRVWTVDFQDLRGGPDTYDLASLLWERAGAEAAVDREAWCRRAAQRLAWATGWDRRLTECAAQRGLKVLGTFARLTANGRTSYASRIGAVRVAVRGFLGVLDAPAGLLAALERPHPYEGL